MQPIEAARRGARLVGAKLTGAAVPFHVTAYVNTACNLRCVYCSSPDQRARLLSAAQWTGVLDELRALGTESSAASRSSGAISRRS
jgi:MoaA/NifB/PqqE/SkfB family radical SAM enzyme